MTELVAGAGALQRFGGFGERHLGNFGDEIEGRQVRCELAALTPDDDGAGAFWSPEGTKVPSGVY